MMDTAFEYDPFSKGVMSDPHPYYGVLRERFPVYYIEKYDTYVFSRFDDVVELFSYVDNSLLGSESSLPDPSVLTHHNNGRASEWPLEPLPFAGLLGSPDYEVLRQAHLKPLRPNAVASLRSFAERIVNERLDALLPGKRFDLTQEFAGIISASMVCHLLDMPLSLAETVLRTVNQGSLSDPETGGVDIVSSFARCLEIMIPFVAKRREAGADGSVPLIDGLLNLDYYDRYLTDEEIATQLVCVFIGGTETVPKIVAHGLMELCRAPDQLEAVRKDLTVNVPIVVEEMIRYCAPAQWFLRTAHKALTIAGQPIKVGQRVIGLVGSAARDEAEFERADEFIWNRPVPRVLSFGLGQRHCIGVHLARLELRVMVREFLRRVDDFSFDMDAAVRRPSSFQWGWNTLPVIVP